MATLINLADPQYLIATAENAKEYQFLLVRQKPQYTQAGFQRNPNLAAGDDLLFKSDLVPDENGQASVPIKSKVKEIEDKIKNDGAEVPVTGVLIGTETGVLQRKTVTTKDFVIKKAASISLKPIRAFAEPSQWAAYHHAVCFIAMEVSESIRTVVIDTEPKPYDVAPGCTGVFVPTAPGAMTPKSWVIGSLGEAHGANAACSQAAAHHGNFDMWSRCFSDGHKTQITLPAKETNFVVALYPRASGKCVLKVYGTGPFAQTLAQAEFGFNGNHPHAGD